MARNPMASVGNEQPPLFPSNRSHSSGSHGPAEVVTYQIRMMSSQRIDSRGRFGCSQATSSAVVNSRYSKVILGFGSQGSKMATKRQTPKNVATPQPKDSPERAIATPPTVKRADTTSVKY